MNAAVDPGEMRTKVEYLAKTKVGKDRTGQDVYEWPVAWSGFAAVRPLSAKEVFYAGGQQAKATHRVTIRWRPGISHKDRFRVAGTDRVLEIASVLDLDDRNAWLVLTCIEKTA